MNQEIRNRLRSERKKAGLTVREVADITEHSAPFIYGLENGNKVATVKKYNEIFKIYGLELQQVNKFLMISEKKY